MIPFSFPPVTRAQGIRMKTPWHLFPEPRDEFLLAAQNKASFSEQKVQSAT